MDELVESHIERGVFQQHLHVNDLAALRRCVDNARKGSAQCEGTGQADRSGNGSHDCTKPDAQENKSG